MLFLYDIGIYLYVFAARILALFNKKIKLWVDGRRHLLEHIADVLNTNDARIWFHFPSLGEFEQGRPVLEVLRKNYPGKKIVITFFSPSGYEIRKNTPLADYVFYLPVDTRRNAREFIRLVRPEMVVFTKYDYWYHYFSELHEKRIPLYVISAIFRKQQPFFKWYGTLNRKILGFISHIFVQDEASKELLQTIGITHVTVSGDTRFDRVAKNAAHPKAIAIAEQFSNNHKVFIAGSTWPEDEKLLAELAVEYPDWKFIIAPHEIGESRITALCKLLPEDSFVRYSAIITATRSNISNLTSQILIIDNIGMLSSLYQYGNIAYIGGGFGVGIHNTLEAAAFGLPVIFGPNYQRFREACELIDLQAAFSIDTFNGLKAVMQRLQDDSLRVQASETAKNYVKRNTGATDAIAGYISAKSKVKS